MIEARVACGAYSNLYSGTYRGQRVAVKVLKEVDDDTSQQAEFLQVSLRPDVSEKISEILRGFSHPPLASQHANRQTTSAPQYWE